MRIQFFFAICVLVCLFAACNKKTASEQSSSVPSGPLTVIDPTTAATVSGAVHFDGAAPDNPTIDMSNDPACKGDNKAETVVVKDGKLANVFVYVKEGLFAHNRFAAPTTPVTLEQDGCRYKPHVVGIMVGQKLDIKNDDPTEHNIHAIGVQNDQWNESQMPKGAPIEKSFDHPEIMLPVKCNQHPWMKMYVNVVANPFFAVTGPDGKFEIKGLPPGDYTLAFVQEKLGEQDQKITLAAKDQKTLDVSFKAQ